MSTAKHLIKGSLELLASRFGPQQRPGAQPHLWVLMYHRILPADDPRFAAEEPGMIVTPETFRGHLRVLKDLFELLPLSEWVARRAAGKPLPRQACAVTFDDGWLDNFEYALPILQQQQVPATLFAVAEMIGTTRQFWPNRLARLLATDRAHTPQPWLAPFLDDPKQAGPLDREAIARVIDRCKQLPDSVIQAHLDEAEAACGLNPDNTPALMDWDQLRAMQQSGLVEVGSHTCNHFRLLPNLPAEIASREIGESRQLLESRLERPVPLFCYPNGDASPQAIELVRRHYQGAVTTRRGINGASTDAHELLRIGVHEDVSNSDTRLRARLSGWV